MDRDQAEKTIGEIAEEIARQTKNLREDAAVILALYERAVPLLKITAPEHRKEWAEGLEAIRKFTGYIDAMDEAAQQWLTE